MRTPRMKPIRMRPADYERTLRLEAHVRVVELELAAIVERVKHKVTIAREARDAHYAKMQRRYPAFIVGQWPYRADDATRTLYPAPPDTT